MFQGVSNKEILGMHNNNPIIAQPIPPTTSYLCLTTYLFIMSNKTIQ